MVPMVLRRRTESLLIGDPGPSTFRFRSVRRNFTLVDYLVFRLRTLCFFIENLRVGRSRYWYQVSIGHFFFGFSRLRIVGIWLNGSFDLPRLHKRGSRLFRFDLTTNDKVLNLVGSPFLKVPHERSTPFTIFPTSDYK